MPNYKFREKHLKKKDLGSVGVKLVTWNVGLGLVKVRVLTE